MNSKKKTLIVNKEFKSLKDFKNFYNKKIKNSKEQGIKKLSSQGIIEVRSTGDFIKSFQKKHGKKTKEQFNNWINK